MATCRLRVLCLVAPFLVGTLAAFAAPAHGDDHRLKLKAGVFDPANGLPAPLVEGAAPAVGLAAPAGRGELSIVQFDWTPGAAERARLAGLGLTVLDYLPEHALIVRLTAGHPAPSLRSIPGVRAVIPFTSRLRLSPDLRDLAGGEEIRINAWLTGDGDPQALADSVRKSFPGMSQPSIRREPVPRVRFAGSSARLAALAAALVRHPDVLFVDRDRPNRLLNDQSIWIGQSYDRVDGPGEAAAADPKPYTLSGTVFKHGLTGTGQVIGVADTRLEHQLCFFTDPAHPVVKQTVPIPGPLTVDPGHRKILAYNNVVPGADNPPYPTWRHGTHTTGSAVADSLVNLSTPSSAGHDTGDGMAPNARLVYLDLYAGVDVSNCTDVICTTCSIADILQQEYRAGARLSTNSWIAEAEIDADAAVWQRPDHLVFFAAGNDGRDGGIVPGANAAKNVVSVGATESYDATFNYDAYGIRDPENMAAFSSLGPAWDGRIKPDMTAPGVAVSSAGFPFAYYAPGDPLYAQHCILSDPNVCFPSFGGCYVDDVSETCSTVKLGGTSMSSPTAAGLGALARQYFTDGFYPTGQAAQADARIPSAALLKAVLINGARNMTGRILDGNGNYARTDLGPIPDAPSNRQGWGRVMLDDALYFAGDSRRLFVADLPSVTDPGLMTRDRRVYEVDVTSSTAPLKFTLVWTDPPAAAGAGKSLRNDLDLVVTGPDGTVYRGNQWTADNIAVPGDMESAANPAGSDTINNVEGVLIHAPRIGPYRFEIQGASVPGYQTVFTQGFAVVATGQFTGGFASPPPPWIESVSPGFGVNSDPTRIFITGLRFQATPQVILGKVPLGGVTFVSPTLLQASVPANLAGGSYLLTVINPDGMSATLDDGFSVSAPLQNRLPASRGSTPMPVPAAD